MAAQVDKVQQHQHYVDALVIDASLQHMVAQLTGPASYIKRTRPLEEPEFEVVWSGRDSLIPDRDSKGSQLSGGEFSAGRRR